MDVPFLKVFSALKSRPFSERSLFVFHGFQPRVHKRKGKSGHKEEMECDFVLVLPGLIIGLECKTTLSASTYKKAKKQLDKLKTVLEAVLGTGNEFRFITCMAYKKTAGDNASKEIEKCDSCSKYVLKFDSRDTFVKKLRHLLEGTPMKPESDEKRVSFKTKVRDLLLFTSKMKSGGDAAHRVADAYFKHHEAFKCTPRETVFFWNPVQYDIIKQDPQFCPIQGGTYTVRCTLYLYTYLGMYVIDN